MKKSPLLLVQAALCALSAIALIAAVLIIYFEGLAAKTDDPMADIYSVGAIADKSVFVLPLLCASIIVTIICAVRGVKAAETGRRKQSAEADCNQSPQSRTGSPDRRSGAVLSDIFIRKNNDEAKIPESALKTVRGVILLLALIFIIIGIFNGSFDDVFIKASNICTECIGLG